MRIGIMCHSSLGGSGRIGTGLAMELSRRGHRVHLFSRSKPFAGDDQRHQVVFHQVMGDRKEAWSLANFEVEWPAQESQALLAQVLKVVEQEGLDLLHFHYALPFADIAGKIMEYLGSASPLVVGTLHGTDVSIYGRHPVAGPQLSQTLQGFAGLTTVSFSHARLAAQVFGLPELPQVIPNFVDLSQFRPGLAVPPTFQPRRFCGKRQPRIVHISNFRALKNPQGLAHIFLGLREKLEAELWLVGEGPELGLVKTLLNNGGVTKNVRCLGACRQVAPILARADLLLMPSLAESFCLTALEAMACGVPVLASDVGGLSEVVVHGKTGWLFPVDEPQVAVELAVQFFSDPARHLAVQEAAIQRARDYEQGQIVAVYQNYYEDLLACRGRRLSRTGRRYPSAAAYLGESKAAGAALF